MDKILKSTEITSDERTDIQTIYQTTRKPTFNKNKSQMKSSSQDLDQHSSLVDLRKSAYQKLKKNYTINYQNFFLEQITNKKKKKQLVNSFKEVIIWTKTSNNIKKFYKISEVKEKMPKIFNYYKNYSKYYCNPFFLDFAVGVIIKMYKEQKARLYYRTQYRKNSHKKESKNKSEDESVGSKSNKIIFNTIIKENIENATNTLGELTLDDGADFLTYKIEFDLERNNQDKSLNFNNFSNNTFVSGVVSRISTEECCKNLLGIGKDFNKDDESLDKISNLNISTNYGREISENENVTKNTETYIKSEEGDKIKASGLSTFTGSKLRFEKKRLFQFENKALNLKNVIKGSDEKISNAIKLSQKITSVSNNLKKKIAFGAASSTFGLGQAQASTLGSAFTVLKKSGVTTNLKKKEEEDFQYPSQTPSSSNIIPTAIPTIKIPETVISPNKKNNKLFNTINMAGINGSSLVKPMLTTRLTATNKFTTRNISKENKEQENLNANVNAQVQLPAQPQIQKNRENKGSNKNLAFISTNKSVDVKKLIDNAKINNFVSSINSNNNLRMSGQLEKNILALDNETSEKELTIKKNGQKKFNSFNSVKNVKTKRKEGSSDVDYKKSGNYKTPKQEKEKGFVTNAISTNFKALVFDDNNNHAQPQLRDSSLDKTNKLIDKLDKSVEKVEEKAPNRNIFNINFALAKNFQESSKIGSLASPRYGKEPLETPKKVVFKTTNHSSQFSNTVSTCKQPI